MPAPSQRRGATLRAAGRLVGYLCFLGGTVTRSRTLRILGVRAVAARALFRGRFDRARRYADELLSWAEQNPRDRNYGNAIHHGYSIRGRVAFEQGDLDQAGADLLASAQTLGSPQLNSFGPNMQLAEHLLKAGRREVVLDYLERCHAFWEMGEARLFRWAADIREGNAPAFDANLLY
jgi:hypothetical protein